MFNLGYFTSHSGVPLEWKIECDDLTTSDLNALAYLVARRVRFSSVYGIPNGGLRFAEALTPYITTGGPRLLVDDVLTTGKSMEEARKPGDIGIVIFARGQYPTWVHPLFCVADTLSAPEPVSGRVSVPQAELARLIAAMDAIYNHNEAARAAVIQHYGIHHSPELLAASEKGEDPLAVAKSAAGSNYVADREVEPRTVCFADGRIVRVVGDGYLEVEFQS